MRDHEKPRRTEILEQLEKILESTYFINAETQGKILRRMVESAISGETIKQQDLQAVTPVHYDVDSSKGRQNALFVRRKLQNYYAKEGRDDLVVIDLPPGRSYRADFSYSPKAVAFRIVKRMERVTQREGIPSHSMAMEIYRADNDSPGSAMYYVSCASLALMQALHYNLFDCGWIWQADAAVKYAKKAADIDPNCWQAYVLQGAGAWMDFNWIEAGKAFEKALMINRKETEGDLWFAAYRITEGDLSAGLRISQERALDDPDNAAVQIVHALFLYISKRYDEAQMFLRNLIANTFERNMADLLGALILLAQGKPDIAIGIFERIGRISQENQDIKYSTCERLNVRRQDIRTHILNGLEILCLVSLGGKQEVDIAMARLRREYPRKPMQSAIAYMATGKNRRAFLWLLRARLERDVLLNWFHLLPLFDPLRGDPLYRWAMESRDEIEKYVSS